MAVLDAAARAKVWRTFMRRAFGLATFTKPELKAAADAVDDWADSNAAAFNTALPTAFRTKATAAQKSALLALVCLERAGLLDEVS